MVVFSLEAAPLLSTLSCGHWEGGQGISFPMATRGAGCGSHTESSMVVTGQVAVRQAGPTGDN